jgi:hypothetical protein
MAELRGSGSVGRWGDGDTDIVSFLISATGLGVDTGGGAGAGGALAGRGAGASSRLFHMLTFAASKNYK